MPPYMAFESKQRQSRHIAGEVEQLGRNGRIQEVIAQPAHQHKHKKAAGAGAKKSVVKANHQAHASGGGQFGATAESRSMLAPHVFAQQGVEQHSKQHKRQDLTQEVGRYLRHQPSPRQRSGHGQCRCGQQIAPSHTHAAAVLPTGKGRAPDRSAFVGSKQRGWLSAGEDGKECG